MMINQEQGIILKKLSPGEYKFSVLTQFHGKLIIAISPNTNMRLMNVGSRIQFNITDALYNVHIVTGIHLIDHLNTFELVDLAWMHHMLELCYYFVPLNQLSGDCFMFLVQCNGLLVIQKQLGESWDMVKRLTVGILLCMFGFYPSEELLPPILAFKRALLTFIDFENAQNIESVTKNIHLVYTKRHKKIEQWVLECIQTHPRRGVFKTLQFMYDRSLLSLTEG